MPASDDATVADERRPLDLRSRRLRVSWPMALVLVWATLAVGSSMLILPSGAVLSRVGAASAVHAHTRQHRHGQLVKPRPAPVALRWLNPVSATTYGPSGPGSGDNNALAPLAIDPNIHTAWRSEWYRSAAFGNLKSGTGLLIDLGRVVRVATVVIQLGEPRGADLRVIAELSPQPPTEHGLAHLTDAGGLVRIRPARRVRARYLLIWFTLLPPDGTGTFQASVYDVGVFVVKNASHDLKAG